MTLLIYAAKHRLSEDHHPVIHYGRTNGKRSPKKMTRIWVRLGLSKLEPCEAVCHSRPKKHEVFLNAVEL